VLRLRKESVDRFGELLGIKRLSSFRDMDSGILICIDWVGGWSRISIMQRTLCELTFTSPHRAHKHSSPFTAPQQNYCFLPRRDFLFLPAQSQEAAVTHAPNCHR
jgi:hypothetical protein